MNKTYTIFDVVSRMPVSRLTCDESDLHRHVLLGHIAIVGDYDRYATRLDDQGNPEPHMAYRNARERDSRKAARLARIEELEKKKLPRISIEMHINPDVVGSDGKTPRQRLADLFQEIAALRNDL